MKYNSRPLFMREQNCSCVNSRAWIIIHVHCSLSEQRQRRRRRRGRGERAEEKATGRGGGLTRRTSCGGDAGVWGGCRWRSKKKEGEKNLQERERDRQCMLCSWWGVKATAGSGDGEGLTWGRWLRLWQRWWPVAEEAKEEENGRGCREERETDGGSWRSVGGCVGFLWCSWWWEDRWWCATGGCSGGGRKKSRKTEKVAETGKSLIFWLILDQILSSLRP